MENSLLVLRKLELDTDRPSAVYLWHPADERKHPMTRDEFDGFDTDTGPDEEEEGAGECATCGEPASDTECPSCAEDSGRVAAESRAERKAEGRAMAADMGLSSSED